MDPTSSARGVASPVQLGSSVRKESPSLKRPSTSHHLNAPSPKRLASFGSSHSAIGSAAQSSSSNSSGSIGRAELRKNRKENDEANSGSPSNGEELDEGEIPREVKEEDEVDQLVSDEEENGATPTNLLDTHLIDSQDHSRRPTNSPQSSSPLSYSQPLTLEQAPPSPFTAAAHFPLPLSTDTTSLSDISCSSTERQDQADLNIACDGMKENSVKEKDMGKRLDSTSVTASPVPPPFAPPALVAISAVPSVPTSIPTNLQASPLNSPTSTSFPFGPTTGIRLPKTQPKIRFSKPPPLPPSISALQPQVPLSNSPTLPVFGTPIPFAPASALGQFRLDRVSEAPPLPNNYRHSMAISTQTSTAQPSLLNAPHPYYGPRLGLALHPIQKVAETPQAYTRSPNSFGPPSGDTVGRRVSEVRAPDSAPLSIVYGRDEEAAAGPGAGAGKRIFSFPSTSHMPFSAPLTSQIPLSTPTTTSPRQPSFSTSVHPTAHPGSINQIRPSSAIQRAHPLQPAPASLNQIRPSSTIQLVHPLQPAPDPLATPAIAPFTFPSQIKLDMVMRVARTTAEYGHDLALEAFGRVALQQNLFELPQKEIGNTIAIANYWYLHVVAWCQQMGILDWKNDRYCIGPQWNRFQSNVQRTQEIESQTGVVPDRNGRSGMGGIDNTLGSRQDQVSNQLQHHQVTSARTDRPSMFIPYARPGQAKESSVPPRAQNQQGTGLRGTPEQQYGLSAQARQQANVSMHGGRQETSNPPANRINTGRLSNSPVIPNSASFPQASSPANRINTGRLSNSPVLPNSASFPQASSLVIPPFVPPQFFPGDPRNSPAQPVPQHQPNQIPLTGNPASRLLHGSAPQPTTAPPAMNRASSGPTGDFLKQLPTLNTSLPSTPIATSRNLTAEAFERYREDQAEAAALRVAQEAVQKYTNLKEQRESAERKQQQQQQAQLDHAEIERKRALAELEKETTRRNELHREHLQAQAAEVARARSVQAVRLQKAEEDRVDQLARKHKEKEEAEEREQLKAQEEQRRENERREAELKMEAKLRMEQERREKERREAELKMEAKLRMEKEEETMLSWERTFASLTGFSKFLKEKNLEKVDRDFQEREKKILQVVEGEEEFVPQ